MRLDPAPLCLRNDGGTLCRPALTAEKLLWRTCDVCGDKYTIELLEQTIKSTWEALRLGYMPTERQANGRVKRLSVTFEGGLAWFHADYPLELQPHYVGFIDLQHVTLNGYGGEHASER